MRAREGSRLRLRAAQPLTHVDRYTCARGCCCVYVVQNNSVDPAHCLCTLLLLLLLYHTLVLLYCQLNRYLG